MPIYREEYLRIASAEHDSRVLVSEYLALLEADLRATALLGLSAWQSANIPRERWRAVAPNLLQAVGALQRPAFGHWNQALYALREALAKAGQLSDARQIGAIRPLEQVYDWLREPLRPALAGELRKVGPLLFYPKLQTNVSRWDAIGISICLRNRAYHDQPSDGQWWDRMADMSRAIAECFARAPMLTSIDDTNGTPPWFIRRDNDWFAFGGLHGNDVVYAAPGLPSVRISASETDVLAAFQHVLGQAEIQQESFQKLFTRLAPEEMKGVMAGDFLLGEPVAVGGFAVVHKGYQLSTGRKVALKVFPADLSHSQLGLLRKEAANLAAFNSPEIVQAIGFFEEIPWTVPRQIDLSDQAWYADFKRKSSPYKTFLAMEWVDGRNLAEWNSGPADGYPSDETLTGWFRAAARALQLVHDKNLAHLDVTPNNLRVTPDGFLKLMDFGIARNETDRQDLMTQSQLGVGTPAYMAPEQFDDRSNRQSDVYGLCATFYELFTRRKLFDHDTNDAGTVRRLKTSGARPTLPRTIRPSIAWEIENLLLAGLDFDYSARPTARALVEDIERILSRRPIKIRRTPWTRRVKLWYLRNHQAVNISAPVVLVTVLIASLLGIRALQQGRQIGDLGNQIRTEQGKSQQSEEKAARSVREKALQEYIAEMRLLPSLWEEARVDQLRERLQRYDNNAEDIRGFEWHYWNSKVNGNLIGWQAAHVTSLEWSADGDVLYATDITGQLTRWDRKSGKSTIVRGPETNTILACAAPVGDVLAVMSDDRTIDILQDGEKKYSFPGQRMLRHECLAISPDGKRLYTGTLFGHLPSFDLVSGKAAINLSANPRSERLEVAPTQLANFHEGEISSIAVSPDSRLIASGGDDGTIGLWRANGTFEGWLREHESRVASLAFSSDGSKLLSRTIASAEKGLQPEALDSGEIIVWSLQNRTILKKIPLERRPQTPFVHLRNEAAVSSGNHKAEFVNSDRQILFADGNIVKLVDYSTDRIIAEIRGHETSVVCLRLCTEAGLLATADEKGEVRVWSLKDVNNDDVPLSLESSGRSMAMPSDKDTTGGEKSGGDTNHKTRLAILQGFGRRTLSLHNLTDFKAKLPEKSETWEYHQVACSPSGRLVASLSNAEDQKNNRVIVWDMASGKVVSEVDPLKGIAQSSDRADVRCLAFRTEDELFAVGESALIRINHSNGKCARVSDVEVGPPPQMNVDGLSVPANATMAIAFSTDGTRAALGAANGTITVYDATSWQQLAQLRLHTRGVTGIAFSADGTRMASCSGKYRSYQGYVELIESAGEVCIWDTFTWQSSLTLTRSAAHEFVGVGFANAGRTLFALSNPLSPSQPGKPRGELVRWETLRETVSQPGARQSQYKEANASTNLRVLTSVVGNNHMELDGYMSVAIQPAGYLLAGLSAKGQLLLWDLQTGAVVREVPTQKDINDFFGKLRFSADGARIDHFNSGSLARQRVSTYTVPDLKLVKTEPAQPGQSQYFERFPSAPKASSPNGRFRCATEPGRVRVLSIESGEELFNESFTGTARGCGFSADSETCYVIWVANDDAAKPYGKDASLVSWNVATGKKQLEVAGLRFPCWISPDMQYGLAAYDASNIFSVDLSSGQRSSQPVAVEIGLRGIEFFPDARRFATHGSKAQIKLWDVRQPVETAGNVLKNVGSISHWAVSPNGQQVAFGNRNSRLSIFNIETKAEVTAKLNPKSSIDQLVFSPDGQQVGVLMSQVNNSAISVVDATQGTVTQVAESAKPDTSTAAQKDTGCFFETTQFFPDNRQVYLKQVRQPPRNRPNRNRAAGKKDDNSNQEARSGFRTLLCDNETTIAALPLQGKRLTRSAISPDGKHVAAILYDNDEKETTLALSFFEIPSAKFEHGLQLKGDTTGVSVDDIRFSLDGSRLELVYRTSKQQGRDATYRIVAIDSQSGQELWSATDIKYPVFSVSADGSLLVRSDTEGRIVVERTRDKKILARHIADSEIHALAFVLADTKVLSSTRDNTLRLWDATNSQP